MPHRTDYVEKIMNEEKHAPSTRANPMVEHVFSVMDGFQVLSRSMTTQDNP